MPRIQRWTARELRGKSARMARRVVPAMLLTAAYWFCWKYFTGEEMIAFANELSRAWFMSAITLSFEMVIAVLSARRRAEEGTVVIREYRIGFLPLMLGLVLAILSPILIIAATWWVLEQAGSLLPAYGQTIVHCVFLVLFLVPLAQLAYVAATFAMSLFARDDGPGVPADGGMGPGPTP